MHASTTEHPRCTDKVQAAWESRFEDLKAMLDPTAEDLDIVRNGDCYELEIENYVVLTLSNLDLLTALIESYDEDAWYSLDLLDGVSLRDKENDDILTALLEHLFDEHEDVIRETARDAFFEYGLAFDYVAPSTFDDQDEGYWRYQISWGGPSEEIRFYASPGHRGFQLHRAEFWYLDWFDGASVTVTSNDIVQQLWDEFKDMGSVESVMQQALEG